MVTSTVDTVRRGWFYRYWPAVVTFIVGWAIATSFGAYMGAQIHDHDAGVFMAFIVSAAGGVVAGLVASVVYFRRNPW